MPPLTPVPWRCPNMTPQPESLLQEFIFSQFCRVHVQDLGLEGLISLETSLLSIQRATFSQNLHIVCPWLIVDATDMSLRDPDLSLFPFKCLFAYLFEIQGYRERARDQETKLPSSSSLSKNDWAWARLKTGAYNSITSIWVAGPKHLSHLLLSQVC